MAINRAIAEEDSDASYHLLLAQIELTAGSTESAFVAFSDALSLDGTNVQAMSGVSQLGLELGRLDESKAATERLLTLDPSNIDALTVRGLIEYLRRRYKLAMGYAERILEIDPANEGGAILATRSLFKLGEVSEAKAMLVNFEELGGITAGSARTRLEIARFEDDPETMEKAFRDLDEEMPGDLVLAIDEANFQFKRGRRDPAMARIETALAHAEATPGQIADTLAIVGEYGAAPLLVERLPVLLPRAKPTTKIALARLFIDKGLDAEAVRALEGNGSGDATALRAAVALRAGRVEEAGQLARVVLDADAENCDALIVAARIALRLGQVEPAIRQGQRATAQCPGLVDGWVVTGTAYSAKKDAANARRVFRDGVAALPQSSAMAGRYADWLLSQGADREAVAAGRRLTRKAPALLSGWALYDRLCRATGSGCEGEAEAGRAQALRIFGVDPKPGDRPPNSLFGRFERG